MSGPFVADQAEHADRLAREAESGDLAERLIPPVNVLGMPAGVVAASRVRAGEESDRPRTRDVVERTVLENEQGTAGLPIGVQVAARHWREDIVLAVMAALEEHFRAQPDYPHEPSLT